MLRLAGMAPIATLATDGAGQPRTAGSDAPPAIAPGTLLDALDVRAFGARFDGSTDDGPALQRAIDRAHAERRAVQLPGGVALIRSPLDLRRREIRLLGAGLDATILRAAAPMPVLLNIEEGEDKINSPLTLQGLTLDGGGVTGRNVALRYRHQTIFAEVNSIRAGVGFWERDAWLSRRFGCRTGDCEVGWQLVGSNHSSLWQGCSFTACTRSHLLIDVDGSAHDGNLALLFRSCDVEFGQGVGIDVAAGATAVFDTCYIGEGIEADVLRNRGSVTFRDGAFFFGLRADAVGVRPLAGRATFRGVTVNSQGPGLGALANVSDSEADRGPVGKVAFADMIANVPVGGTPIFNADLLDRADLPTFAPRLGRDWTAWARGGSIRTLSGTAGLADAGVVTCVAGGDVVMALAARLAPERWRESAPVYFACLYRSTRPVQVRLSPAFQQEPAQILFELPAAPRLRTFVNVQARAPSRAFNAIELVAPGSRPGDRLELHELTLADGTVAIGAGPGNLAMLALAR